MTIHVCKHVCMYSKHTSSSNKQQCNASKVLSPNIGFLKFGNFPVCQIIYINDPEYIKYSLVGFLLPSATKTKTITKCTASHKGKGSSKSLSRYFLNVVLERHH